MTSAGHSLLEELRNSSVSYDGELVESEELLLWQVSWSLASLGQLEE